LVREADALDEAAPTHPFQVACWKTYKSPYFERVSIAVILINVAVVVACHFPQNENFTVAEDHISLACLVFFTAEMILGCIALGSKYTQDGWNLFDVFVVVSSWFGMLMGFELAWGESVSMCKP
jgi:hypothetical protein